MNVASIKMNSNRTNFTANPADKMLKLVPHKPKIEREKSLLVDIVEDVVRGEEVPILAAAGVLYGVLHLLHKS